MTYQASSEIAEALKRVKKVAAKNKGHIVQSKDILRKDRELLIRTKWLQETIKGWYLLVRPDARTGDSSTWFAHFWDFLKIYLKTRFGQNYCLSAESSIDIHTKRTTVPKQVTILCKKGGGYIDLPFDTSLFSYVDPIRFPDETKSVDELIVMTLPFALCKVSKSFFQKDPAEAAIALSCIKDSSELSQILLKYNLKTSANRLVGAYQHLNKHNIADELTVDLTAFGWKITPENPFNKTKLIVHPAPSPHAYRIYALWNEFRKPVLDAFKDVKPSMRQAKKQLLHIEEIYQQDAYHSLSIEGYQVNENLILRIQNNDWSPDHQLKDLEERNALAARGYYEAFLNVKNSIQNLMQKPSKSIDRFLKRWYQCLFAPIARVGLIPESELLGYRKHQVYIRNSRHVPLPPDTLIDAMEALFDCLENEKNAAVRAVLGHYIFVFIHPYMDGNGRLGRFLMNALLVSGGYPWTIIRVENRNRYLDALETAGYQKDIRPFAKFIKKSMKEM